MEKAFVVKGKKTGFIFIYLQDLFIQIRSDDVVPSGI